MSVKIATVHGRKINERVIVVNTETGAETHIFNVWARDIKFALEVAGVAVEDIGYLSKGAFYKACPGHKFANEW